MEFFKMHGLGNDFAVIDCLQEQIPGDYRQLARQMCDRHFGIGADGLVLILPSENADIRMRIFNPDGSEPEMCGNAIRCVARFVYDRGIVREKVIQVETLAGTIIPEVVEEKGQLLIKVDMGEPRLERKQVPMEGPWDRVVNETIPVGDKEFKVTCLSMGNPHCVTFVEDVDKVDLCRIGPKMEKHNLFPARTNVEFVQVLNAKEVKMRVWERGAGETLACGTGACATGVAAVLNSLTGKKVTVHLAGGDLIIEWAKNNHVYMTGPADYVFTGDWPAPVEQ